MRERIRLGKLLVSEGLLSEEKLMESLSLQKQSGLKLGQYLIQHNICHEKDIVAAISSQVGIDTYSPAAHTLDREASRLLPQPMAVDLKAVPLFRRARVLHVAMPDPLDIDVLDKLEAATNGEVEPAICTEQEFNQLLSAVYGMFTGLEVVVGSMGEANFEYAPIKVEDVALSAQESEEMAPVIRLVNSFLMQAIRDRASDIHISPEKDSMQVRFRIDGQLRDAPAPPRSMAMTIVSRIKILGDMDIAVTRLPQDGRFTVTMDNREINIRVSSIPTIYGENIVMRLLDMTGQIYSLTELGLNETDLGRMRSFIHKPYGMVLATGPTGSGKSSSLYAILKEIFRPEINIITLEDPVEYRLPGVRQVQLNRRAGMTFASGLRAILRQDPDVIMVGEIRDAETASIAVQAALTGHLVFSTLHTNNASGAPTRLTDMGIEPFLVSSVLLGVFAQRLVRQVCPKCAEPCKPSARALRLFQIDPEEVEDGLTTFRRGTGCHMCRTTGYQGRCGVFELLPIIPEIQELISKRASSLAIATAARHLGIMRTLAENTADKIRKGITTPEAAATVMV